MLTLDVLRNEGVAFEEGLARCMNMEAFYLGLVGKALKNDGPEALASALEANDLDKAFEAAHALKGMYSNLSLTPLEKPVKEMTEALRVRNTEADYPALLQELQSALERLRSYL
ncbi:MAG: Hpt domain-containing protein [Lachnospiraceae bacterium]|nr:Hpt domain-containing protein [Lachnospiraceae bacterium]